MGATEYISVDASDMPRARSNRVFRRASMPLFAAKVVGAVLLAACAGAPPAGDQHPDLVAPTPNPLELSANVGESATGTVQMHNTGGASLSFSVDTDEEWLTTDPVSGTVQPDAYQSLTVVAACPETVGTYMGTITIDSNDPSPSTHEVDTTLTCTDVTTPPPPEIECEEIDEGAAGPTLRCVSAEVGLRLEVPWQGEAVRVESLPVEDVGETPAQSQFEPLGGRPVIHVAIFNVYNATPRQLFDPPLEVWLDYDAQQFEAATPLLNEGELGLGVWDGTESAWVVAGHGVFHDGFWVADPIGSDDLILQGNQADAQPRFQITGKPEGGRVVALFREVLPTLPIALGALPYDPDHMLKSFDSCKNTTIDGLGDVVECTSAMVGLTVRVPLQEGGTVTPEVVALPWNKATTFIATEVDDTTGTNDSETDLQRRLMNFVVVDADDPDRVLTSFDPPMEFEVLYAPDDKEPEANPVLRLNYWDEYMEEFVVLGEGACTACREDDGSPIVGCTWGNAVAAGETSDPEFGGAFFRVEAGTGEGRAKFTFDRWGDRMVAFAR